MAIFPQRPEPEQRATSVKAKPEESLRVIASLMQYADTDMEMAEGASQHAEELCL